MHEIQRPPSKLRLPANRFSVFLAGSIELGECENWQSYVESAVQHCDVIILNPRRDQWDDSWQQSISDANFRTQVEWELEAQQRASMIVLYFSPTTKAPISLLELGLFARSGKLVVCCPDGFWRKGNVEIVCEKYDIPTVDSIDGLVEVIKTKCAADSNANSNHATLTGRQQMTEQTLETLGESEHLALVRRNGWSFVRRQNQVSVVGIVAVTPADCLLLVEQYRPPVDGNVISLPAGLAGDDGDKSESLQTAAERELLEETGFSAASWSELATVTSSAGLTNEVVTLFRAYDLTRKSAGGGVANEQIIVHEISRNTVAEWLREQADAGKYVDGRVYAALYWADCD